MPFVHILKILWNILDRRGKWQFSSLVSLQMVSGIMEMGTILVIFGFIRGLAHQEEGKHQHGLIANVLRRVLGESPSHEEYVWYGGLAVFGFILVKHLTTTVAQFLLNRFLMKRNLRLSVDVFNGFINAPFENLQPKDIPKIQAHVVDINRVFSNQFSSAAQILSDGMTLALMAILLLRVDPLLTIGCALVFGGVGGVVYWTMQKALVEMGREEQRATRVAQEYLAKAFNGIIDIRIRDLREPYAKGYERAASSVSLVSRRVQALKRVPRTTNEALLTALIVGAVIYLTLSKQSVETALPTLILFGFAGLRMTAFFSRINASLQRLKRGAEKMDKLEQVLHRVRAKASGGVPLIGSYLALEKPRKKETAKRFTESLRLEDVSFAYARKKQVLSKINVTVRKGQFVALCGPSGGGKSTLVKVMMGLFVPSKGRVWCDDWNVFEHIRDWHGHIAYVGQDLFLPQGTVRENVALGVPVAKIDEARMLDALRSAQALDFVQELPDGLDSDLLEGRFLSGGQRQRIVIARALYSNTSVLVLDEATAALDNETERAVAQAIRGLRGERTIISVAHRLSSIRDADEVHYVDGGRIVDSGTFSNLYDTCPGFKNMVDAGSFDMSSRVD